MAYSIWIHYLMKQSDTCRLFLFSLPTRKKKVVLFALMQMMGKSKGNQEYLAQAQAIKDATMGWFIAHNIKDKFLHFNGNYHSDFKGGIIYICFNIVRGQRLKLSVQSVRKV